MTPSEVLARLAEIEAYEKLITDEPVIHKTEIAWLIAQLRKSLEAEAGIVEAASRLRNEVKGTLSAHEIAIRYDHGNSNWKCLEMALEMVDSAIAEHAKLRGGE